MADGLISDRSRWLVLGWQWSLWEWRWNLMYPWQRRIRLLESFYKRTIFRKRLYLLSSLLSKRNNWNIKEISFFPNEEDVVYYCGTLPGWECRSERVLLLFLCFMQKIHPQSILKRLSCKSRVIGMVLVCLQRWCWAALNSLNLLLTINASLFNVLFCK